MSKFIYAVSIIVIMLACDSKESIVAESQKIVTTNQPATISNGLRSARESSNSTNIAPPPIAQNIFKDGTGKITIKIFKSQRLYGAKITAKATVEPDFVLVGGGAFIDGWSVSNRGAFIMESRPENNLKDWVASSSHINPAECHFLTSYAVGMRLDGVSADVLRSKMKVFNQISGNSTSAISQLNINNQPYILIGGGAKSNSSAPLAASIAYGNSWYAATMPTIQNGSVTSYVIGIDKNFVNSSRLEILQVGGNSPFPQSSLSSQSVSVSQGRVITSIGGRTLISSTAKRGLVCNYLDNGYFGTVITKDFEKPFTGQNVVNAVTIRKY